MRQPKTDIPGVVVNEAGSSRIAFCPADIDRRYALDNLPDHADLMANLVRWTARGNIPLEITGHGLIDCELYTQPGRVIVHLVNLTNSAAWRSPAEELTPIGPLNLRVKLPQGSTPKAARLLVADKSLALHVDQGWGRFDLPSVTDHEVVVLE